MKLFIAFILLCFITALLLRKRDLTTNVWVLFGLSLLVSIGYFFFNQI
jgi:hypothetical protein